MHGLAPEGRLREGRMACAVLCVAGAANGILTRCKWYCCKYEAEVSGQAVGAQHGLLLGELTHSEVSGLP